VTLEFSEITWLLTSRGVTLTDGGVNIQCAVFPTSFAKTDIMVFSPEFQPTSAPIQPTPVI